jgi:hypothetical protein
MGLRHIINIIQDEQLCNHWELEEENVPLLSLFYEKFNLYLMYEDGKLITIFHMKIHNNDIREHIKRKYKIKRHHNIREQRAQVFTYQNDFYIQIVYKRFTKQIIWHYSAVYSDIEENMVLAKNDKKNIILYPRYNINEEREPRLNYPILDSELL